MAVRNFLATLIVTLSVGLAPIPALADGIVRGRAEFIGVNLTLTFIDAGISDQDIVEIVLYGSTAVNFPITWASVGVPLYDPPSADPGFDSTVVGEGTQTVTITINDVAGGSVGFNPGEVFVLFGVDADPGVPVLADLEDVGIDITFRDNTTFSGRFSDQGDPLRLMLVPEPRTAILLVLGLLGLAASGRRRV